MILTCRMGTGGSSIRLSMDWLYAAECETALCFLWQIAVNRLMP